MNQSRGRLRLIAVGLIGLTAALAFAVPAGAAVVSKSAPTAALVLGNKATLDANGAVVFASVKVSCTPGKTTYLSVTVTENVGGFIASGTGNATAPCKGHNVTTSIAVTPTQRAFAKGVAFGQAELSVCGGAGCDELLDQHNIQIVKK
jgi:hypothetical protein